MGLARRTNLIFVLDDRYASGPFPDKATAFGWVEAPHHLYGQGRILTLYSSLPPMGTIDTAQHAGSILLLGEGK